jgi:lipopolysaccharide transport system permease protein
MIGQGVIEFLQYRELLVVWTLREIKARYTQTVFGFAWAIFQPIALTVIFVVAFSYFVKLPSDGLPYPIFIYTAMLPWAFFTRALGMGIPSIVSNMSLVTKIYLPRAIFPMSTIGTSFVDFVCGLVVLIGLMVYYQIPLNSTMGLLPVLFLIQLIIMLGIVLGGAALNVFYRDIGQMVGVLLQIWMYACPIVYPVSVVPAHLRFWYMLNPMAVIINGYRQVILLAQWPNWYELVVAGAISILILIGGYLIFKRLEPQFADVI